VSSPANASPARDPDVVVLLLPHGDGWVGCAARREGPSWRVVERQEASAGFAGWVEARGAGRVLAVLPADRTVCRSFSLPAASPEQLDAALRLHAEAAFLGGVPSHRVGLAVLSAPADAPTRQGVVLAWPESMAIGPLPTLPAGLEPRFIAGVACLCAVHESAGTAADGMSVAADRRDGSILFLLRTPSGLLIRSTREESDDPDRWRDGILRAARETLFAGESTDADRQRVLADLERRLGRRVPDSFVSVPDAVSVASASALAGAEAWPESDRLLAAGALLAISGPLAPLAGLRGELPRERPHPIQVAIDRISEPHRAARLIVAAIAAVMLLPLVLAGVRYGLLSLKVDDLDDLERANRITRQQVAMYRELRRNAWPIGKILGDLANVTPEGVEVETVSLGQTDGLTLRGIAKPSETKDAAGKPVQLSSAETVGLMQQELERSGVFHRAKYEYKAEDGRGWREFTIVCEVKQPTRQPRVRPDDDYAVRSLRDRRYPNWREIEGGGGGGETASGPPANAMAASTRGSGGASAPVRPVAPPPAEDDATEEGGESAEDAPDAAPPAAVASGRGIGRRGSSPASTGGEGDSARPQPTGGTPVDVPPPISDEEIAALSKSEALAHLNKVAKARQSPSVDQETKDRLRGDFDRLMLHIRKAS